MWRGRGWEGDVDARVWIGEMMDERSGRVEAWRRMGGGHGRATKKWRVMLLMHIIN